MIEAAISAAKERESLERVVDLQGAEDYQGPAAAAGRRRPQKRRCIGEEVSDSDEEQQQHVAPPPPHPQPFAFGRGGPVFRTVAQAMHLSLP